MLAFELLTAVSPWDPKETGMSEMKKYSAITSFQPTLLVYFMMCTFFSTAAAPMGATASIPEDRALSQREWLRLLGRAVIAVAC